MSRRGRRRAIGALDMGVVAVVAGCGSETAGSDPTTTQPALATVEAATSAAPETDAVTQEFITRFESGIAALQTARMTGETVSGEETIASEGVVDYSGSEPAQSQTVTLADGSSTDMIVLDGMAYLRASTDELWYVTDAANIQGAANDPQAQMSAFAQAIVAAEQIGTEEVNSVTADVFDVVLDPALLGATSSSDSFDMSLRVWLDSEDFPVQMSVSADDGTATMTMSVTMSEINGPVTIEAPSPDEVTDTPPTSSG